MSNGDDVLDSWEEIDEAGLTNKLQKINEERKSLEQKQQKLENLKTVVSNSSATETIRVISQPDTLKAVKDLQHTQSQEATTSTIAPETLPSNSAALKSPLDDMPASFQPVMMVLHQPADEYQSANYMAPTTSQTVKILRRPTQSSGPRNNGIRPRQPIKTLQQREQEYAEARLRILGSAKNPEDDIVSSAAAINNSAAPDKLNGSSKSSDTTSTSYNSCQSQAQQLQAFENAYSSSNVNYKNPRATSAAAVAIDAAAASPQRTWSPVVGGSVSSSLAQASLRQQQQQQQENVLRMPRGPDADSTGFRVRR